MLTKPPADAWVLAVATTRSRRSAWLSVWATDTGPPRTSEALSRAGPTITMPVSRAIRTSGHPIGVAERKLAQRECGPAGKCRMSFERLGRAERRDQLVLGDRQNRSSIVAHESGDLHEERIDPLQRDVGRQALHHLFRVVEIGAQDCCLSPGPRIDREHGPRLKRFVHKCRHLEDEVAERGFFGKQDVIGAVHLDELGTGDLSRELHAFREGRHAVAAGMQDERWHMQPFKRIAICQRRQRQSSTATHFPASASGAAAR